jgi:hypothetical protein
MLSTEGHQAGETVLPPCIKYTYRFEDYLATARAQAWNGVFGRHTYWLRYLVWGVLGVVFLGTPVILEYLMRKRSPDLLAAALPLAGFAGLMIVSWLLEWLYSRFAYRRLAIAGADLVLKFEADGIHYKMPSYHGVLSWSGIRRVMTPPGYLLLFISKSEAMALPRRAFSSDRDFGEILRLVRAKTSAEAVS